MPTKSWYVCLIQHHRILCEQRKSWLHTQNAIFKDFYSYLSGTPMAIAAYTRKNLPACQQDVFALLVPSCWQVWNKLLSSCNKVEEANSCSNKSEIASRKKLLTSWW
jgi:hypothetical protein